MSFIRDAIEEINEVLGDDDHALNHPALLAACIQAHAIVTIAEAISEIDLRDARPDLSDIGSDLSIRLGDIAEAIETAEQNPGQGAPT